MKRPGPKSPEGLAAVRATIRRVNAEGKNVRRIPAESHGVHTISRVQPQTKALADQIIGVLEGEGLTHIRPADRTTVELLATTLRRIMQAESYLDRFGLVAKRGEVRPVAQLLVRLLAEARAYCEALAMTPRSRAQLGLDTGRALDVAEMLSKIPAVGSPSPATSESTSPALPSGEKAAGSGESAVSAPEAAPEPSEREIPPTSAASTTEKTP